MLFRAFNRKRFQFLGIGHQSSHFFSKRDISNSVFFQNAIYPIPFFFQNAIYPFICRKLSSTYIKLNSPKFWRTVVRIKITVRRTVVRLRMPVRRTVVRIKIGVRRTVVSRNFQVYSRAVFIFYFFKVCIFRFIFENTVDLTI